MKMRSWFPVSLLAATAAMAGPYDQPWSQFETEGASQVRDTRQAGIMKIDGKAVSRPGRGDPVAPGKHVVEVSVPGARGMSESVRKEVEIDAKPCTRYIIVAARKSRTGDDWFAKVDRDEPIGECRKKFGTAK